MWYLKRVRFHQYVCVRKHQLVSWFNIFSFVIPVRNTEGLFTFIQLQHSQSHPFLKSISTGKENAIFEEFREPVDPGKSFCCYCGLFQDSSKISHLVLWVLWKKQQNLRLQKTLDLFLSFVLQELMFEWDFFFLFSKRVMKHFSRNLSSGIETLK